MAAAAIIIHLAASVQTSNYTVRYPTYPALPFVLSSLPLLSNLSDSQPFVRHYHSPTEQEDS